MQTENPTEKTPIRIAFLGYLDLDKGSAYRGGILVTDEWGKPVEFRCTAPVRPNPVQRTLYGQTLLPHIAVELIGVPLLRTIQEKPELLVIQEEVFFDVRHHTELSVVRLRRQGTQVKVSGDGAEKTHTTVMDSPSGKFQPVVMEAHREFRGDAESSGARLRELFARWDLLEPFERLARALDYVHQQKVLET